MEQAPWRTIPQLIDSAAQRFPTTQAISDGEVAWTFPEITERIHQAARALIATGVAHGERVSIWAPNIREWEVIALAIHSVGAVLVPINTRFKAGEAVYVLEKAGVRRLFTVTDFLDIDYVAMLRAGGLDTAVDEIIVLRGESPEGTTSLDAFLARGDTVDDAARAARAAAVDEHDLCHVLFTSGTTGNPKGVMLEHGPVMDTYLALSKVFAMQPEDRQLILLPFFHSFGLHVGIICSFMVGSTVVPHLVFDPEAVMHRIAEERITAFPGPPSVFQVMLTHPLAKELDLSSLRSITIGAAGFPPSLVQELYDTLGVERIQSGYGLTESSGTVSLCSPPDTPEIIATTAGRPIPGLELRIVDDEGNSQPAGEVGEILVRGFTVMRGYLDEPEQTAATIDADGWLHTGDVGYLRPDERLVITDRKKDMFNVGGFNAYPAEIEAMMGRHPDVAQAAVIGVPDERLQEVGMAFVVLRPGASADEAAMIAWCREQMANYKVPRSIRFVDALPMNATGKVLKGELRAAAAVS